MARTPFTLMAAGPASGAVSPAVPIDSTNGMQVPIDSYFVPQNIDRFGLWLVVFNSAAASYNVIVRNGVLNGGTGPDLVTGVTNGTVAIIGPLPPVRYGNPSVNVGASNQALWVDFSNTLMAGTILAVCGLQQLIPSGAQVATVKSSPGTLLAAFVSVLGTAAWNAYDDAMAPNGSAIATFAGSAAVGSMTAPNRATVRGIVSSSLASGPVLTAFYA